jgi:hypothetical protein
MSQQNTILSSGLGGGLGAWMVESLLTTVTAWSDRCVTSTTAITKTSLVVTGT